ncbi:alpha/beta fold hydrolase [Ferrimonas senticii]|uniref:alpha/beta fold hydrolase n=1 Tax=Ferrimonas senticii TaxID=394566 RepID=UPI00040266C3|nr:alpha/beta hydrolase [Ferrimonas senticii]
MQQRVAISGIELLIDGSGTDNILMIHGWPDTHHLWDNTVEQLANRFRCGRFTLPGYDRRHPRQLWDLPQMMTLLDQIVETFSPDQPVTLLIHDWGCFWGYQYYMRRPERVARIIAVDIGDANSPEHVATLSAKAKLYGLSYQLYLALAWKIGGAIGDAMTRKMAAWLHAPELPARIHSGMTYSYWWKWSNTLRGIKLGSVVIDIRCPLLFIYGKDKPVAFHSTAWTERMAAIAGNQVIALDTGHWVMHQQPTQFNQLVADWLHEQSNVKAS